MNIFWHEIRSYLKSTLAWTISLSVLAIVFLLMFTAFNKDVEASQKVIFGLPLALREALGISLKNFFTVYGFYAYLLTFASLAGAVQAMNLGVSAISKEESGKTADFLLSKPVSRSQVLTSKLLATLCLLVVTNLIFSLIALFTAKMVTPGNFSAKIFLFISATLFLIQLFFLALGALFAVSIPKIKSVIAVSLPTTFAFFIIGTLGAILGNENVRYLTPFKFYDPMYIIDKVGYEPKFLLIELAFVVIAISASYYIFLNKDIRAAS